MLTPAYDLLSTSIVMPEDDEELALTLNGKKKKIKREDFEEAMRDKRRLPICGNRLTKDYNF